MLRLLTLATEDTGIIVSYYGVTGLTLPGDQTLKIAWDDEAAEYVVDDRNGS